MSNADVLFTIRTPFEEKKLLCDELDLLRRQIRHRFTIKILPGYVSDSDFSLSVKKELMFSVEWSDTKVYRTMMKYSSRSPSVVSLLSVSFSKR